LTSKPRWLVYGSIIIVILVVSAGAYSVSNNFLGKEDIIIDLDGLEIYSVDLQIDRYFNEYQYEEYLLFDLLSPQLDESMAIFVVFLTFSVSWEDEANIQQGIRYLENQPDQFRIEAWDEQGIIDKVREGANSLANDERIGINWQDDNTDSCFVLGNTGKYRLKGLRVIEDDEIHITVTLTFAGDNESILGFQDIEDDGNDVEIYMRILYHAVP